MVYQCLVVVWREKTIARENNLTQKNGRTLTSSWAWADEFAKWQVFLNAKKNFDL